MAKFKARFKVGQRVKVVQEGEYQDYEGTVMEVEQIRSGYFYRVSFRGVEEWFSEWPLEAVDDGTEQRK